LASKSKKPEEDLATALSPFLQPTQEVVRQIRELKLDRDFDRQQKAITEAITCLSWMLMTAPKQLPIPFVKETLGSAEFWTNRIRKDFRGKDEKQIEFCDSLKKMMGGLEAYIEQYHKTGLTFNPKGLSFKETAIRMSDEGPDDDASAKTSSGKRRPTLGVTAAPNMLGLIGELAKKRNEDGSSAATGLKHVSTRVIFRPLQ
jgi:adenylyl cyclase-associated protein